MKVLPCLELNWLKAAFYNAQESEGIIDAIKMNQVHSADCLYITEKPTEEPSVDALVTDKAGLKLTVKTADCAPILIADQKKHLIAAVHAGWKGAFQGVIENTVLNSLLPISKADICKLLPDISPTTVEAVLGKMVKSGVITTIGNGRGTKYIRK